MKRLLTQFGFAFLQNPFVNHFLTGKLYKGGAKKFCTPGLNCHSCPAAVTTCPMGAAQLFFASNPANIGLFVVGFLLIIGVIFGRLICGYVCPMGLLQDLIYKIKTRKFRLKLRFLRYLKYVVLVLFVVILPLFVRQKISVLSFGENWFCKYICPSGTVATFPILISNASLQNLVGRLYLWKVAVAVGLVSASVVIHRFFCRVVCPLGAFYSLFNKIAFVRMGCDKSKCTSCRQCEKACDICINPTAEPNSPECVRCGSCIRKCHTGALRYESVVRFGKKIGGA